MLRCVLITLQLHIVTAAFPWVEKKLPAETSVDAVSATLLRGSAATGASSSGAKIARGHSNYAPECVECLYSGTQCGCGPAMEYLACLTKHCYKSEEKKFSTMCAVLQSHCFGELNIDCQGPDSQCEAKFHQLSSGGLGLSWDVEDPSEAPLCGPFGKCIGDMHMNVQIHNVPSTPVAASTPSAVAESASALKKVVPAEAPPTAKKNTTVPCETEAHSKAVNSTPVTAFKVEQGHGTLKSRFAHTRSQRLKAANDQPSLWLECGLPNSLNADINNKEDWTTCISQVFGESAKCKIPMLSSLPAAQEVQSYCVLTDGAGGKRLSQPLLKKIRNTHAKQLGVAHESTAKLESSAKLEPSVKYPESREEVPVEPVERTTPPRERSRNTAERAGQAMRSSGDSFDPASHSRPPWKKPTPPSQQKPPPPGSYQHRQAIIKGIKDFGEASRESSGRAARRAKESGHTADEELERQAAEIARQADKANDPLQQGARDMKEGSKAAGAKAAGKVTSASNTAADSARKAGDATAEAARKADQARKRKRPPYMKGESGDEPPDGLRW